jgi:hypothetical protein
MSSDTIPQKLLARLKISPLTRAQLADLLYLDCESVRNGIKALQRNGLVDSAEGVRIKGTYADVVLRPTTKGEAHIGPIPYKPKPPRLTDLPADSIVCTAVARVPSFVFHLGGVHA